MNDALLTSAQAARLLGVTAATVKRWSDAGLIPCLRTAGAHRRFSQSEVARFLGSRRGAAEVEDAGGEWADRILAAPDPLTLHLHLLQERGREGAWWRLAERLGLALNVIGERWARGLLSVVEEHAASERLGRALARCAESLPPRPDAPRVLLASAEGDHHTLGLALAEVALREAGWSTLWAGRDAPGSELIRALAAGQADVLALSASLASERVALGRELDALGPVLYARGVPLLAGGTGPWPEPLAWGTRIRDFPSLRTFVSAEEIRRGPRAGKELEG